MADTDAYVTNDVWLTTAARRDAVDEIADQFERRAAPSADAGAVAFWSDVTQRRAERMARLAPRSAVPERRAG